MPKIPNWRCRVCNRDATISIERFFVNSADLVIDRVDGPLYLRIHCIPCGNPRCTGVMLEAVWYECVGDMPGSYEPGREIQRWQLIPPGRMMVIPDYVPAAIAEDYEQACSIVQSSPNAAATLARRCLQSMIRDFWGIKERRLVDEIDALKGKIDPLTWQAIDALRRIGNIGAHLEEVNASVELEVGEARELVRLLELLVEEWYVAREARRDRLSGIVRLARSKSPTSS